MAENNNYEHGRNTIIDEDWELTEEEMAKIVEESIREWRESHYKKRTISSLIPDAKHDYLDSNYPDSSLTLNIGGEERIWIDPTDVKRVYLKLKNYGIPLRKINDIIQNEETRDLKFLTKLNALYKKHILKGLNVIKFSSRFELSDLLDTKFGRFLYPEKTKKSYMTTDVLDKLELLVGEKIPHLIYIGQELKIERENDNSLAEFIGICLGDGSLSAEGTHFGERIILDSRHDRRYVDYVAQIMYDILGKKPTIDSVNGAFVLIVWGKGVAEFLISKGLISGDKVRNQVGVPIWIKENYSFVINCLKGLVDTDGSIHVDKQSRCINIKFSNASLPLISDFQQMCQMIGVQTGNVIRSFRGISEITGREIIEYNLLISSKEAVRRFIGIIKPQKWEYRFRILGLQLIALRDSVKWNFIKKELEILYPDRKTHWNEEYEANLRRLCEEAGYLVSIDHIINALEESFTYQKQRI